MLKSQILIFKIDICKTEKTSVHFYYNILLDNGFFLLIYIETFKTEITSIIITYMTMIFFFNTILNLLLTFVFSMVMNHFLILYV